SASPTNQTHIVSRRQFRPPLEKLDNVPCLLETFVVGNL
ncbi:unnamed protein product, partial [Musa acuminata subsp. burmannicoides]